MAATSARSEPRTESRLNFAAEAAVLVVHHPKRQQLRRFELRHVLVLFGPRRAPHEVARHADDFQALVAQVMRLLRIEREDAKRQLLVRTNQRGDLLETDHL